MNVKTISPLDFWLLKWVVGPIVAMFVIWTVVRMEIMKYKCQQIAEELGYIESTFVPRGWRSVMPEECICQKKLNPDGTIDENATQVINLDVWKRKKSNNRDK